MNQFLTCLVQIIDSFDRLGVYRKFTSEQKLAHSFLLTKEEKQQMVSCGHIDPKCKAQIALFFQAVALVVEQRTGKLVSSIIEMNDEGFGRAILYSGRLILLNKGLRGTQQFAFTEVEKVSNEGEKIAASAIEWIERFPEIVNL